MSFLVFFQNLGTSIGVVLSTVAFTQTLAKVTPIYAPSVSSQAALDAGSGARAVRDLVKGHEDELNGVLRAYSESLRNVFLMLVGFSCLAVVLSIGMGWLDVRTKEEVTKSGDGEAQMEQAEKGSE